jgi:hypothetical protein
MPEPSGVETAELNQKIVEGEPLEIVTRRIAPGDAFECRFDVQKPFAFRGVGAMRVRAIDPRDADRVLDGLVVERRFLGAVEVVTNSTYVARLGHRLVWVARNVTDVELVAVFELVIDKHLDT